MEILKKIASLVGAVAPTLGTVLLGPVGTAAGAGLAMVAEAIGGDANKPEEILERLTTDPTTLVKIKELELNNSVEIQRLALQQLQAQLDAQTKQIEAVNQTMQAESKSEHWPQYSWRPFWGGTSAVTFFVAVILILCLAFTAVKTRDMNAIAMIPQLVMQLTLLFGVPAAILGVASWHRGKMQREKIAEN